MLCLKNLRVKNIKLGTATASNATATGTLDTLGYDEVAIAVALGSQADTTAVIAMKIEESNDLTTYTSITEFTGGTETSTSAGFSFGTTAVAAGSSYFFHMTKTGARKRYLKVSVTPGTTAHVTAIGLLGRAKDLPSGTGTAEQGDCVSFATA